MWFTNQSTGFHVVRITNGVSPFDWIPSPRLRTPVAATSPSLPRAS